MTPELAAIKKGYVEAMFFTEHDELYLKSDADFSGELYMQVHNTCDNFLEVNRALIEKFLQENVNFSFEKVGQQLWFTRNGHGVGFWEYEGGVELAEVCRKLGETWVYVGDDGKIY